MRNADRTFRSLRVETLEDRVTPVVWYAIGTGGGIQGTVKIIESASRTEIRSIVPYPGFQGEVHVAMADLNRDGFPELITAAGPGAGPHVKVYNGADFREFASFFAFTPTFRGGVNLALGDVSGDGVVDIVVAAGPGAGPHVRVLNGATYGVGVGSEIASFFAFETTFNGGVSVASANLTGDAKADILAGQQTRGTRVRVFDGASSTPVRELTAFAGFAGGVWVAAVDVNNDGQPDIIAGANAGGGPHVKTFLAGSNNPLDSFFAFDPRQPGGVRFGVLDANNDGKLNLAFAGGSAFGTNGTVVKSLNTQFITSRNLDRVTIADGAMVDIRIPFPGYGGPLFVG